MGFVNASNIGYANASTAIPSAASDPATRIASQGLTGIGGQAGGMAGGLLGSVANPLLNSITPQMQFSSTVPNIAQQNFQPMIQQGQQNIGQLNDQQQSLAHTLLAQSQGQGPNLGQLQLNQALDQASRQSAGVMAGQKGISAGTAQRLAGQNQAMASQGAAQGSAMMRAQQQLGSQGQLGGIYGQMSGEQLQNQGILQNAQAAQNNALVQASLGSQGINERASEANLKSKSGMLGGLLQGAGSAVGMAMASSGGKVPGKANVPGDSEKNDTVNTMLSPGEIVIPRTHSHSPEAAKEFIDKLMVKEHSDHYEVKDKDKNYKVAKKGISEHLTQKMKKMADGGEVQSPPETPQVQESSSIIDTGEEPQHRINLPKFDTSSEDMPQAKPTGQSVWNSQQNQNSQQLLKFPNEQEYEKNLKSQEAGVSALGAAQSSGAAEQAKAYENQQKAIQSQMDSYKAGREALDAEHKQLFQDVSNTKIDPNRIWHDASTGQKVAASIGMILGGMGAGLTGGPNQALGVIQALQNRDLEAQKMDLGKKESLLSRNLQKYHNLDMAMNATMLQQNAMTQGLVASAAARSNSAQARAQAQITNAQLENQAIPMRYDLSIKHQLMNQINQGGSGNNSDAVNSAKVRVFVPQSEQPKAFESLGKVKANIHLQKRALEAFDRAAEEFKGVGGLNPQAYKRVASSIDPLAAIMAKGEAGRFTEQDYPIFRGQFPKATDTEETLSQKRKDLSELISGGRMEHEQLLEGYNIRPTNLYQESGQKNIQEGPAR